MTLAEQDFWIEQADLLHEREKAPENLDKYRAKREWEEMQRVAHEWVVA